MRKPRLSCVVQLPPPVHGASVINDHVVRSELLASRFDVDVIPLKFADSIEDVGRISLRKLVRTVSTAARLVATIVRDRPAGVYLSLSPAGAAFYRDCLFVAILKAFGVPHTFHLHGRGVSRALRRSWNRPIYRWAFRDARVIHLSSALASDVSDLVAPEDLYFVANGIEDAGAPIVRASSAKPRILFLSNMLESKGPLVLVEALGILARRDIPFEATFAGAPVAECVARFRSEVRRLDLSERVSYVGPVFGDRKDALLAEHDLLALPTANEAFPLVLLEAMRSALPVVTTREGAIPEIVEDGVTGLLVPSRDPAALAARLEELLRDEVRRVRMGQSARTRYLEHFTLQRFERDLVSVLERCFAWEAA